MEFQSLFERPYVENLRRSVEDGTTVEFYKSDVFEFDRDKVLLNPEIRKPEFKLLMPDGEHTFDKENSRLIHAAYSHLTPLQASDIRLWTYLAHADLYPYMCKRWPAVRNGSATNGGKYILDHWFISTPSQPNLLRHGLAGLWWAAYLSHDANRADPYELTDILYRQLDLATRTLGTYKLARYRPAVHGILEFMLENDALFKDRFEAKQRFVTKHLNQVGGVKPLPYFGKEFFKDTLDRARIRIGDAQ